MRRKCRWCPKRGRVGEDLTQYFINGRYMNLCNACHERYKRRTDKLLDR